MPMLNAAAEMSLTLTRFHMSIIEASNNVVRLYMIRSMFNLLTDGDFYNRKQIFKQTASRKNILEQHPSINLALQNRYPVEALQYYGNTF